MDRRTFLRTALVAGVAGCTPATTDPTALPTDTAPPSPPGSPAPAASPSAPAASSAPDPTTPAAPRDRPAVSRELLGLDAPAPGGEPHTARGLMLHHTAAPTAPAEQAPERFRAHARGHREAGFVDVAYHWGVGVDGTVYQLRDEAIAGETFTDYDPAGWLLVVCEGNFEESQPPQPMLEAVADVFAARASTLGIDPVTLVGHRDLAATACPGQHLQAQLGELTGMIQRRLGEVELVLTDDPTALP